MTLDERMRELADDVPAPPPGDAGAAFRRGVRRRRTRRTVEAVAAVGVVAVLGVGVTSMLDGPTTPQIAERPPATTEPSDDEESAADEDVPVITGPEVLAVGGSSPFPSRVAVSPGEDDRWCATTRHGDGELEAEVGDPCDELLTPEQAGAPDGFGTIHSEFDTAPDGEPSQVLSWGFAPVDAETVDVLFTDGSRQRAVTGSTGQAPAPLWAIGHLDAEVQAVEARQDGEVIAGHIRADEDADAASPHAVFGDRLEPEDVEAFTAEQQRLLDLRTDDELFRLPVDGTDRWVGIRARDGWAPLLFAAACDLLDQVDLPEGWVGICLEYTDSDDGRQHGLFPHGTTTDG